MSVKMFESLCQLSPDKKSYVSKMIVARYIEKVMPAAPVRMIS